MPNKNQQLADRRRELGLTLEDVAKSVGVSKATVSRWESGEIDNMRRDRIAALAKVLRVSPLVIMGIDDDSPAAGNPPEPHHSLSPEDQALLAAYHAAPPEKKMVVDITLKEYMPEKPAEPAEKKPAPSDKQISATVINAPDGESHYVVWAQMPNAAGSAKTKKSSQSKKAQIQHVLPSLLFTETQEKSERKRAVERVYGYIKDAVFAWDYDKYKNFLSEEDVQKFIYEIIREWSFRGGDEEKAYRVIAEEIRAGHFDSYFEKGASEHNPLLNRIRNRML